VLNISTELKANSYKAFDEEKKIFYSDQKFVQSGMVQSWNKFCFIGGVVEFRAKLPGDPKIGGLWPACELDRVWRLAAFEIRRRTLSCQIECSHTVSHRYRSVDAREPGTSHLRWVRRLHMAFQLQQVRRADSAIARDQRVFRGESLRDGGAPGTGRPRNRRPRVDAGQR
jgi:Beta-glucan synthesis-associated protein SKN1/KRE6/Sbg1